jgi:membrane associated rhomboid family serine protease
MISNNKNKQELCQRIKSILNEIPFFIRFILITKILLFIINIFSIHISFYLSNIPIYTFSHYQFWRLLTTSFITTNLINMLIGFIVWIKDAISLEKSLGTIRYIIVFITNSICINLMYCSFVYLLNLYTKNNYLLGSTSYGVYKVNNSGIWPIIICEMTLLCLNNPDSHIKFLFRPCPIRAKYYPVFIIIIYVLINNFRINFAIISGFIYGIIYFYLLQNRLNISDFTIRHLENSFCCKCLIGFGNFVNIDNINNNAMSNGYVPTMNSLDNSPGGFSPFQGKGITIGSTNDYVAVNDQNRNNTLDVINNSDNKN